PGVALLRLLLRIEHELDGPAMRPERARVEGVKTFVDRLVLGNALFELERMDRCHLGVAAEDAYPRKARLEVLDRRQRHTLCPRGAARNRRPEALYQLRRDADQQNRRKVG